MTPTDMDNAQNMNGYDAHPEDAMVESHLVETTDEDGNVHIFEKIDEFDVEDNRYALLLYMGEQEEGGTLAKAAEQLSQKLSGATMGEHHEHGPDCNHNHDEEGDEELVIMKVVKGDDGADWLEEIETDEEYEQAVAHLEHRQNNGDLLFDINITDIDDDDSDANE